MQRFGFCVVIMVENIKVLIFKSIWKDMASFIRLLVPMHPSKMESLNGKNRHLLEVVRASLIAAKIPISYWGEAITFAAYLINRVPSSSINFQTPLQALTNVIVAPNHPKSTSSCFWLRGIYASTQTPTHQVNFPCIALCVCWISMLPSSNSTNVYYNGCGVS